MFGQGAAVAKRSVNVGFVKGGGRFGGERQKPATKTVDVGMSLTRGEVWVRGTTTGSWMKGLGVCVALRIVFPCLFRTLSSGHLHLA